MSPEALKQDFESALVKHISFKARLRSFLYGNAGAEGPLRDPNQCSLGQWIASRQGTYAHVPEMRDLDQQHRLVHERANELMDLRLAGRHDEALAGLRTMQTQTDDIAALLQTIEAKLRTAEV